MAPHEQGAMYIFVFMWTPKLEPHWKDLPHSRVFGSRLSPTAYSLEQPQKFIAHFKSSRPLLAASVMRAKRVTRGGCSQLFYGIYDARVGPDRPTPEALHSRSLHAVSPSPSPKCMGAKPGFAPRV
jgi:hypothetical protein